MKMFITKPLDPGGGAGPPASGRGTGPASRARGTCARPRTRSSAHNYENSIKITNYEIHNFSDFHNFQSRNLGNFCLSGHLFMSSAHNKISFFKYHLYRLQSSHRRKASLYKPKQLMQFGVNDAVQTKLGAAT